MGSIMREFYGARRKVAWQGTPLKTGLTIAGCMIGWFVVLMLTGLATSAAMGVMVTSVEETGFSIELAWLLFLIVCVCFVWMAYWDVQRGWIYALGLPRTALIALAAWGLVCMHVLTRADMLTTPAGYLRIHRLDGHIYPSDERVVRGLMEPTSFLLALRAHELRVKWGQDKLQCDFTVLVDIEPGSPLEEFVSRNGIWNVSGFDQAAKAEIAAAYVSGSLSKWVSARRILSSSCVFGARA